MTDKNQTSNTSSNSPQGRSAGAQLRAARETRGMHIAALAAAIKVAPSRLEALEADNFDSMPDITFARALAQAVCRALKVDPAPVLAAMPESMQSRLERVDEGIKTPFRERSGGHTADGGLAALWRHPVVWLAVLLLAGAAAFLWWPSPAVEPPDVPPAGSEPLVPAPAASEPIAVLPGPVASPDAPPAGAASVPTAVDMPGVVPALAASAAPQPLPILAGVQAGLPPSAAAPVATGDGLVLRAVQDSWVQVTGADGKVLIGRTLVAGETASFAGPLPLRVRIGNVAGTEAVFAGQPLDIRSQTRDNTLRLTLPPPADTGVPPAPAAAPATPVARPSPKPAAP